MSDPTLIHAMGEIPLWSSGYAKIPWKSVYVLYIIMSTQVCMVPMEVNHMHAMHVVLKIVHVYVWM